MNEVLRHGDLVLDEGSHEVYRGSTPIRLTRTEFALLRFFLLNPRRVLTRSQILQNVWRNDFTGNPNVVETYVSYLRRKLETDGPPLIRTVRQAGYMLDGGRSKDSPWTNSRIWRAPASRDAGRSSSSAGSSRPR